MCSEGGFKLTKIVSNSRLVNESIPEVERSRRATELSWPATKRPRAWSSMEHWRSTTTIKYGVQHEASNRSPKRFGSNKVVIAFSL